EKIEQTHELKKRSDEYLSALQKHLNDSLLILQNKFENFYKTSIPDQTNVDSTKKKELESTLDKLSKDILDFQLSAKNRYIQEEKLMKSQLKTKIYNAVEQFSKKNNIKSLADKEALIY